MNDSFMPSVPAEGDDAVAVGGRDIIRRKGDWSLTPAQLESRALIQRMARASMCFHLAVLPTISLPASRQQSLSWT